VPAGAQSCTREARVPAAADIDERKKKGPDERSGPDAYDSQRFAATSVSAGRFISLIARASASLVHFTEADAAARS